VAQVTIKKDPESGSLSKSGFQIFFPYFAPIFHPNNALLMDSNSLLLYSLDVTTSLGGGNALYRVLCLASVSIVMRKLKMSENTNVCTIFSPCSQQTVVF